MLFPVPRQSSPPPRVAVTGAGIVTALGFGWEANAEGLRTGKSGFGPVTLFDVSRQRVQWAAEISLAQTGSVEAGVRRARLDRAGHLLQLAAEEALSQCAWSHGGGVPIVLGTTSGGMSMGEAFYRQAISSPYSRRNQPTRVSYYQSQRQVLELARVFNLSGPATIVANACASGADAIGIAWELVRSGAADRVLTGGYEALSQLVFAGFDSLQALTTTRCRPFDAQRDGLALGEGAAVLCLERMEYALSRGARVIGEIAGYGQAMDIHHLTQPHPEGDAALNCMVAACRAARVAPEQVEYVNAHGTGTVLNDSAEALAINRWAGEHVSALRVSSTKAGVGHLLGASGAVEAVVSLMALQGQWLPPMRSLQTPEPLCKFSLVTEPETAKLNYVLSNSFGFGGANAALLFRRAG